MDLQDSLVSFLNHNKHLAIGTLAHLTFIYISDKSSIPLRKKTRSDWLSCTVMSLLIGISAVIMIEGWGAFFDKNIPLATTTSVSLAGSLLGYRGLSFILDKFTLLINLLIRKHTK